MSGPDNGAPTASWRLPARDIAGRIKEEYNECHCGGEDRPPLPQPAEPRGHEYTYREVTAAVTGQDGPTFSPAYLWQLRTGAKDNPTMRHLEALARFFLVSPSYFFDDELTGFPDTEVRLLVASRNDILRQMAVTLLGRDGSDGEETLPEGEQLRLL